MSKEAEEEKSKRRNRGTRRKKEGNRNRRKIRRNVRRIRTRNRERKEEEYKCEGGGGEFGERMKKNIMRLEMGKRRRRRTTVFVLS